MSTDPLADFQHAQRANPMPIFIWQQGADDFRLVGYNPAGEAFMGAALGRYFGMPAARAFENQPEYLALMRRAIDTGCPQSAVLPYRVPESRIEKTIFVSFAIHTNTLLIAYVWDLTALESSAEAIRLHRAALDACPYPIAILSAQSRTQHVVEANHAFAVLVGMPESALAGRPVASVISDLVVLRRVRDAARKSIARDIVSVHLCGEDRDAPGNPRSVRIVPYPGDARVPHRLVLIVTPTMPADAAGRADFEPGFSTLLQVLPGLVYRCRNDAHWTMERIDGRCLAVTGYAPGEILHNSGTSYESLIHIDDRTRVRLAVDKAIAARMPFEIDYRIRHRSGRVRYVREQGTGVYDANDALVAIEGFIQDVTKVKWLARRIKQGANVDWLTGSMNLSELGKQIEGLVDDTRFAAASHSLAYIDLDGFRLLNENAGTDGGNQYLRDIAKLCKGLLRKQDRLARIGGDRFGVLLEDCSSEAARELVQALRGAIGAYTFTWDARNYQITASIGLVHFDGNVDSPDRVLTLADECCNMAKDLGRNRVFEFDELDEGFTTRREGVRRAADVMRALEEERLLLFYQPIRAIASHDEGAHFEILVRMVDDDGTVIAPGQFLPAAERYQLISRIDRWVVRTSMERLLAVPAIAARIGMCSINVSGQSLRDDAILEFIVHQFGELDIDPHKICFEITETAAIEEFNYAIRFIRTLKSWGCRFALDDFGSGMSSFGYLKQLHTDFIKIDGQFVRDIATDATDLAIVKAIASVAGDTGKRTIAEFVESAAALGKLKAVGVDFAQGYHIGRPQPITAFIAQRPEA